MKAKRIVLASIAAVVVVLVVLLLWSNSNFIRYVVPSESMVSTFEIGDQVFAEKHAYDNEAPKQGDIVTFAYADASTDDDTILVKRVAALAGQTVDLKEGAVYVDGNILNEEYTEGRPTYPLKSSSITYPYTVPAGHIWVMGDNRVNSIDSRWFGAVPLSNLTGKVSLRYWPLNRFGFVH